MEGRVQLVCAECGRRHEVVGEMPEEFTRCFAEATRTDGWVIRPGSSHLAMICGTCLRREFSGHETVQDEEKVQGRRGPFEL